MHHLVAYSSAPETDRFHVVDGEQLAEIGLEISTNPPSAEAPEFYRRAYRDDLEAVKRALVLQRQGETILVARDEDGYFFGIGED